MPDLIIQTFPTCSSNIHWQKTTKKGYTVTYGKVSGPYVYNWHCTCKGFKFRNTCKHVKQATEERCTWGEMAWAAEDASNGEDISECPACSAPLGYVRIGV